MIGAFISFDNGFFNARLSYAPPLLTRKRKEIRMNFHKLASNVVNVYSLWRTMGYQNVDDKIPKRSVLFLSPCIISRSQILTPHILFQSCVYQLYTILINSSNLNWWIDALVYLFVCLFAFAFLVLCTGWFSRVIIIKFISLFNYEISISILKTCCLNCQRKSSQWSNKTEKQQQQQ